METAAAPDPEICAELLRRMVRIRLIEEAIARRYPEERMRCPIHLSVGQEAVAAAAGLALRRDDAAVSTHRAHAHYLGKGGDLQRMIAELYGKATGCSGGRGGSMHLIDTAVGFMGSTAIVGGTIPVGVGLALSITLKKLDRISVVFLGDGSVEEGVFYESVNFAALKKLPVLFICENNLYSVYSHLRSRQPAGRSIMRMVEGIGIPGAQGDGNDALECYARIREAAAAVRGGAGPFFLEFATYRWLEHCGPNYDNHIGYRTEAEFLAWKERDPIPALRRQAEARGLLRPGEEAAFTDGVRAEIDAAFLFAERSPFPPPEDAYTLLYGG